MLKMSETQQYIRGGSNMCEQGYSKDLTVMNPPDKSTGQAPANHELPVNKAVMNIYRYLASQDQKKVEAFIDFLSP